MASQPSGRLFTLLQRELREYRASLLWTPVAIAVILALLMLASVLVINRFSVFGDAIIEVITQEHRDREFNIEINLGSQSASKGDDAVRSPPAAEPGTEYIAEPVDELPAEAWDFSRGWTFNPPAAPDQPDAAEAPDELDELDLSAELESLNPVLNALHNILLLVLLITTTNYLLGTLYEDRKDRSILFWRSMPVSEWETVLSKLMVALLIAPAIVLAISLLLQIAFVFLAILLVWRLDMQPAEIIVSNVAIGRLLMDQIGGWLLTALLLAPSYAWLLLASAAARRSPFMLAFVPLLGVMIAEPLFFGTEYIADSVQRHTPHIIEGGSSVGFYLFGPEWSGINVLSLLSGLVFAGAALYGAVWLRRHRWEI